MATSKTKKSASKKKAAAMPNAGAVPPYGPPIRAAMARGDMQEMRRVAASARKWIKDAQAALDKLEQRMTKMGGK
ncbi:MAG TPA: DUF1843 domain-containing protein [Pyrinomonadaceae bacterium]|nr:DUF1843 domain-containing protein [Pyrinomonadaceae bacterium]